MEQDLAGAGGCCGPVPGVIAALPFLTFTAGYVVMVLPAGTPAATWRFCQMTAFGHPQVCVRANLDSVPRI